MKNLINALVILLFLMGCNNSKPLEEPRLYLFETSEYCDYDDSLRVIYIKSHRQLQEVWMNKRCLDSCSGVYNALGHEVSNDLKYPKIIVDTLDPTYDITLHLHPGNDSTLMITAPFELHNLNIVRYYMISEECSPDIFQFLDPLCMIKFVEKEDEAYIITLENYKDIDFEHGERVVLEYEDYKIPVPYQIFMN